MKLTYWYAPHQFDSDVYSIRTRTKAEAVNRRSENPEAYGPIVKVTVEYADGFALMEACMGEGGLWEESQACQNHRLGRT